MSDRTLPALPRVSEQIDRLADLGLEIAKHPVAASLPDADGALVAVRHDAVPAADLVARWTLRGKEGFVVEDMTDLDEFLPTPDVDLPESPLYLVTGLDRGDDLRSRTPADAATGLAALGRSPLTVHEGLSWLLQQPDTLADNHCFMTIASRRAKPTGGYDARTPALWISRGNGRDGASRLAAPKLGWCWWNNHHTWLGIASCTDRLPAAS